MLPAVIWLCAVGSAITFVGFALIQTWDIVDIYRGKKPREDLSFSATMAALFWTAVIALLVFIGVYLQTVIDSS